MCVICMNSVIVVNQEEAQGITMNGIATARSSMVVSADEHDAVQRLQGADGTPHASPRCSIL
jgi:hypothetical protein